VKPIDRTRTLPPSAAPTVARPDDGGDTRVPPDPCTAVLPAMAALGTIASIAAINWSCQDKTPDRARSKRKAATALKELETCCLGLAEIFRRFQRLPRLFGGEAGPSGPMKFGVHGTRVGAEGARAFQQLMNDVASMLVLASQNAVDVMSAVEDGEIVAPEEVYFGFAEQQERLNALIGQRAPLKQVVAAGVEIAERLAALVGELRRHRIE
jgi:hypothetical protein